MICIDTIKHVLAGVPTRNRAAGGETLAAEVLSTWRSFLRKVRLPPRPRPHAAPWP